MSSAFGRFLLGGKSTRKQRMGTMSGLVHAIVAVTPFAVIARVADPITLVRLLEADVTEFPTLPHPILVKLCSVTLKSFRSTIRNVAFRSHQMWLFITFWVRAGGHLSLITCRCCMTEAKPVMAAFANPVAS